MILIKFDHQKQFRSLEFCTIPLAEIHEPWGPRNKFQNQYFDDSALLSRQVMIEIEAEDTIVDRKARKKAKKEKKKAKKQKKELKKLKKKAKYGKEV